MKNVKYEYDIVNKEDGVVEDIAFTRECARTLKNELQSYGVPVKIVQKKYIQINEKVVR